VKILRQLALRAGEVDMERFNFRYDHGNYDEADYYESSLAFSVENAYLWDVLEKVGSFLRGAGFAFDGELKIVAKNEMIVPQSFVNDSINKEAYRQETNRQAFTNVGSPVEVTKGAEFGINITDVGQTAV
jgi:hypothetical protein